MVPCADSSSLSGVGTPGAICASEISADPRRIALVVVVVRARARKQVRVRLRAIFWAAYLVVVPHDERKRRRRVQHAQLKRLFPLRIERLLLDRCLGLLAAHRLHHHKRVRRAVLVSGQQSRGAHHAHGHRPARRRPECAAAAATAGCLA
eukprot:scaffold39183_cov48-Phaeocystis_antarctica.AAC.1